MENFQNHISLVIKTNIESNSPRKITMAFILNWKNIKNGNDSQYTKW